MIWLPLYFFAACFLALALGCWLGSEVQDEADARPVVDAEYLGVQLGYGYQRDTELWNLGQSIPGHPSGSTVSTETIERAGYRLP